MIDPPPSSATAQPVRPLQAIMTMIALVPIVGALLLLGSAAGVADMLFMGFVFVLYWAGVRTMTPGEYWPALSGSLGGLGLAFLLAWLPAILGFAGTIAAGLAIILSVYLLIRGLCGWLVNHAFMLFLTLGTCGMFTKPADFGRAAFAIALAAFYAGGLAALAQTLASRRSARP